MNATPKPAPVITEPARNSAPESAGIEADGARHSDGESERAGCGRLARRKASQRDLTEAGGDPESAYGAAAGEVTLGVQPDHRE